MRVRSAAVVIGLVLTLFALSHGAAWSSSARPDAVSHPTASASSGSLSGDDGRESPVVSAVYNAAPPTVAKDERLSRIGLAALIAVAAAAVWLGALRSLSRRALQVVRTSRVLLRHLSDPMRAPPGSLST